jgi:DDE superfamily endonuclease
MPAKASKLKPLTVLQKENNTKISSQRVRVEHAISGVKRSRIVKDKLRSRKNNQDDLVMEIACGLHNFRVRKRNPL